LTVDLGMMTLNDLIVSDGQQNKICLVEVRLVEREKCLKKKDYMKKKCQVTYLSKSKSLHDNEEDMIEIKP
jgi:hypothetical protein